MLALALISLGLAGSALSWPSFDRSHYAQVARAAEVDHKYATGKAPVSMAWYTSWNAGDFPVNKIPWKKYSMVTYAFAKTTPDVNKVEISDDPKTFKDFLDAARKANVLTSLSIGGWTDSRYFSTAVDTAKNRTAFVKTMTELVKKFKLDGLDFDWEYPAAEGIGCNTNSPNDTANFLLFLTELRHALPKTILSAATAGLPFLGPDLAPSSDVSAFAKVLDFITIMNYDVWGSWMEKVGPNAPLDDSCAADQAGSAVSAVKAWTAAGMPANKIMLGVASYGHSYSVAKSDAIKPDGTLASYPPFNASAQPVGDAWDPATPVGSVDVCGNPAPSGGNWNFWGLIKGGFLTEKGKVNKDKGILYRFDKCSQTSYVYNKDTSVMISYDDAASFAAKGKFIRSHQLRGFSMWELGGDYHDILLDSIRSGAGFSNSINPFPSFSA